MTSLTLAIVRVILGLYPRRFRDRFRSDVLESVRHDLKRAHGVAQFVVVSTRAVIDALAGLVPEHRSEGRRQHRVAAAVTDDIRDAIRSLRQSPTFSVVALGVLSLAIGAGTAIYSVVDAVALRGLPFDEHDRIVAVLEHNRRTGQTYNAMQQNFLDWRDAERSFEHLAASRRTTFRLRNARNEPADARALRVTAGFFDVLRVWPAIGRAFGPQDEIEGRDRQVILSDSFWQNAFGGAPDMVGRTITLNNQPWTVVGVMPRTFSYPVGSAQPVEIFAPLAFGAADRARVGGHNYQYSVIGRLKRGVSIAQAADDIDRINVRLSAQHPGWNTLNPEGHIQVVTLHQRMVGPIARRWMWLLLGSVALVVLIACANVANLMLARATVRARELSLRAALGASAWRLTRALLVEGVVLSLSAAAIGLVLALGGVEVLRAWLPEGVPRVAAIAVNLRVLVVTILAASLTGIFFGVVPAIHGARPDLTATLREGSRSLTPAAGRRRVRQLLVVVEVALAVVLVVGAGLFVTSFIRLMRIDPGFDYKDVLAINVAVDYPPDKIEAGFERGRAYVFAMLDAVRAVPGVQSAEAVSGGLPLSGGWSTNHVTLPGRGELTKSEDEIGTRWVTAGYLELLRVPLIRGRYLQAGDREGAPPVVVINQAAAAHYWPGTDPIGQRVTIESFPAAREMTVVGVVGDIRHRGLEEPVQQEAYIPIAQHSVLSAALVMRTAGTPIDVLPAVKRAIWSVNPDQRIFEGTVTLEGHLDRLIAQRRFNMALLALFGVLGLVIAAVGIYGVMAFAVAQRVSEIGIRMALGASPGMVMVLVLRNAATLIVIGLLIGAVGAWNLSASAEAFLFQVAAKDFWIFLSGVATLAVAGLVASVVPARRAARVDPLVTLRS